jgi:hypothetical protein
MKRNLLFNPDANSPASSGAGMGALDSGIEPSAAPTTPAAPSAPPAGTPSATPGGAAATPTATPAAAAAPVASPTMTSDQIAELVSKTVKAVAPAAPAAPQKQWTQEEFNRTFNVYTPTQDDVTQLLAGGDQAIAAVNRLILGAVKQATTMAALQHQQSLEEFRNQHLSPLEEVRQDYIRRQTEAVKEDFFKTHPDLKTQERLVIAIGTQLQSEGFQGTKEQAFTEVAKRAKEVLATAGVQLAAAPAAGQSAQPSATPAAKHQMASLTIPGGGAGAPPATVAKKPGLAALD